MLIGKNTENEISWLTSAEFKPFQLLGCNECVKELLKVDLFYRAPYKVFYSC